MEVGDPGEGEWDLLHVGESVGHVDDPEASGVGCGGAIEAVFKRDYLLGGNV